MILLVAAMVGLAMFAAGFVWGTHFGVQQEYERWHEGMARLDRMKREGVIHG